jgi:glutamine amidotransferase
MHRLEQAGLDKLIPRLTQPFLGICLGMQLLHEASDEANTRCLGIIPGRARMFDSAPNRPVPHMGWNRIRKLRDAPLLAGITDGAYFYFVHSYAVDVMPATFASAEYGRPFTAIAGHGNFWGAQFHPERSGANGAQLLRNFLQLNT